MNKGPDAFRTISEVAEDLVLPQHVLRFWETRFSQIKPMKRGGGRRYYRPDDIDLLRGIKHLLYEEGYTIRGLQRIFKEQGNHFVIAVGRGEAVTDEDGRPSTLAIGLTQSEPSSDLPPEPPEADFVEPAVEPQMRASDAAKSDMPERSGPAKRAVPVSEIGSPEKPKSLLGRLRGRGDEPDLSASVRGLSAEDRRNLQATLYELLECKRLLDQVREQ